MAWFYGTYACGHNGRVNIVGKMSERQKKADRYFSRICEECRIKEQKEEAKKSAEKSAKYEFPELQGSEKQVAWANTIRLEYYERCEKEKSNVDHIITKEVQAKFWIDNRTHLDEDFVKKYDNEKESEIINKSLIDIDAVKPSDLKHDGVVEIVENCGRICLKYERNQEFIDLVKEHGYKWSGVWNRSLTETTGKFEDRAAEIGHALLQNGFCISIHDDKVKEKAISGQYEKEHTRWIYSRANTSFLSIGWNGRNDALYAEARKLPGSKWDSPNVIVDVSHYRAVENFAFENGFYFTEMAKRKIEKYKSDMKKVKEVNV